MPNLRRAGLGHAYHSRFRLSFFAQNLGILPIFDDTSQTLAQRLDIFPLGDGTAI